MKKILWITYYAESNGCFQPHIGTKENIFRKTNNIKQI